MVCSCCLPSSLRTAKQVLPTAAEQFTKYMVCFMAINFCIINSAGMPVTSVRELRVLQSCRHPNLVELKKVVTGKKLDRHGALLDLPEPTND